MRAITGSAFLRPDDESSVCGGLLFIPSGVILIAWRTGTAQQAALRVIAAHLRPGGLLVLDLIHPNPELLGAYYGAITHETTFASADGHRVDRFVSAFYRAATQTVEATWFYDLTAPDRTLSRIVVPFSMRLIGRYEIELLLHGAGFTVEAIYADTDLSPLDDGADRMLVVAVRGKD
ncbi:MAG: hypothetical protein LC793_22410 [Thermomicrobia bacterium]|nr:hypothetical protein [Thermomicrobia bacterium]